jgi:lipoyl synthase
MKVRAPSADSRYFEVRELIHGQQLHTICEEARCPNIAECWGRGTATFQILGETCTRACRYCYVHSGRPEHPPDPLEPLRLAAPAAQMGLKHVVVTSVDRDDLPDGGAGVFAHTIRAIRKRAPDCAVEVLTPDFRGQEMPLARVIDARPDVFNHNVETVPRLYPKARRGSNFLRSCRVLRNAKHMDAGVVTKSGLMVGLGETMDEMLEAFALLREHEVQVLTVGQYLRPSENHLPLVRYWTPDEFAELEREAYAMGFESVASGPLVRSSYHADEQMPVRRASA